MKIKIIMDGVESIHYTDCIDTAISRAVHRLYDRRHEFNERMDGYSDRDCTRYGQIGRGGSMKTGTIRIDISDENGYKISIS